MTEPAPISQREIMDLIYWSVIGGLIFASLLSASLFIAAPILTTRMERQERINMRRKAAAREQKNRNHRHGRA